MIISPKKRTSTEPTACIQKTAQTSSIWKWKYALALLSTALP